MKIEGVVSKHVFDSSLEKVNDVELDQSGFGRMFNYGDVDILTGNVGGANKFLTIAFPVEFKRQMLDQKEALGTLSDFGTREKQVLQANTPAKADVPQLIAELDELRLIFGGAFAQLREDVVAALEVGDAAAACADQIGVRRDVGVEAHRIGEWQRPEQATAAHRVQRRVDRCQSHRRELPAHRLEHLSGRRMLAHQDRPSNGQSLRRHPQTSLAQQARSIVISTDLCRKCHR